MSRQNVFDDQDSEDNVLNYQNKKIFHAIELEIIEVDNNLHYIQKKHSIHQIKEVMSHLYNIFNETEPLFNIVSALFLHKQIKKILNCFGIIYVILMKHIEKPKYSKQLLTENQQSEALAKVGDKQHGKDEKKTRNAIFLKDKQASKINKLGGIYLYNEGYKRNMDNENEKDSLKSKDVSRKVTKKLKNWDEYTRQQLRKSIEEALRDNELNVYQPIEQLDHSIFKYGSEQQTLSFREELMSIAKFFKESQNDAYQFLKKNKDQVQYVNCSDKFKDIQIVIRQEHQLKMKDFHARLQKTLNLMKQKADVKLREINERYIEVKQMEIKYTPKEMNQYGTQTYQNLLQEMTVLRKQLNFCEQKVRIISSLKQKQQEQGIHSILTLQNELNIKSRELVYLKLNLQENGLIISTLNKKIHYLLNKIALQSVSDVFIGKNKASHNNNLNNERQEKKSVSHIGQEQFAQIEKEIALNNKHIQDLKMQKKFAKKMFLQSRRGSLAEQKPSNQKRLTQLPEQTKKTINNFYSKYHLSEINEDHANHDSTQRSYENSHINTQLGKQKKPTATNHMIERRNSKKSLNNSSKNNSRENSNVVKSKFTSLILNQSQGKIKLNGMNYQDYFDNHQYDELGQNSESYNIYEQKSKTSLEMTPAQLQKLQRMFKRESKLNKKRLLHQNISIINSCSSKENQQASNLNQRCKINGDIGDNNRRIELLANSSKSILNANEMNKADYIRYGLQNMSRFQRIQESNPQKEESYDELIHIGLQKQLRFKICEQLITIKIDPSLLGSRGLLEPQSRDSAIKNAQRIQKYSKFNNTYDNFTPSKVSKERHMAKNSLIIQSRISNANSIHGLNGSSMTKLKKIINQSIKQELKNQIAHTQNTEKSCEESYVMKNGQKELAIIEQDDRKAKILQHTDYRSKELDKEEWNEQKMREAEDEQIREMARKCKSIQEFKKMIASVHYMRCGANCKHLQRYISNYSKYKKQINTKTKMKMHIQDVCENIKGNASELPKVKTK